MDRYRVRRGRTEFMTKRATLPILARARGACRAPALACRRRRCAYDAAAALEFLLAHAAELRLDPHAMSLEATSAGGGPASYLLWVHRRWHAARYTPRAYVYSSGQLLYPVQNALGATWGTPGESRTRSVPARGLSGRLTLRIAVAGIFADALGGSYRLADLILAKDCVSIVGNPWCDPWHRCMPGVRHRASPRCASCLVGAVHARCDPSVGPRGIPMSATSDYSLCNATWHEASMARFCGDRFNATTLAQLRSAQRWVRDDPEVGRGLEVLWQPMLTMRPAGGPSEPPLSVYFANTANGTGANDVVHHAVHARTFAARAAAAGIRYTAMYPDYRGMRADARGLRVTASSARGEFEFNYASNEAWLEQPGVRRRGS
jgi:hypothetical protein